MHRLLKSKWTKAALLLVCLEPLADLMVRQYRQDLGANPVEYITHQTGVWALRFLAMTLAISPARKVLALPDLIGFRRMLGLFAFFYAYLHFTTYAWLDKFFDFGEIWKDVWKRPFITAGFAAFLLMLPLAITSTAGWIRRLGGKRWQMLHRLVYGSAIAGAIHYYWLVKSDVRRPLAYAAVFLVLFLLRLPWIVSSIRAKPEAGA
jgi:methionine sulfoxide reductase heme-binding subunit